MTTPIRLELPTGFEFGSANAYLFTEPEPVLVDTGLKSQASWQALQAGLAHHQLTVADLSRVIITHPHIDHCGQAALIAEQSQAGIWIAEAGRPWLLDFGGSLRERAAYYRDEFLPPLALPTEASQWLLAYMLKMAEMVDSAPAERLHSFRPGETLSMGGLCWQILHAPGHASAQTCFYQADTGQLLSADMLLARTPAPVVEKPAGGNRSKTPALAQFLESLRMIEALEIERVYPGHGEPFGDHRPVIQRQRERIEQRKHECFNLVASGQRTVAALMDRMYGLQLPGFHLTGLWMLVGYLELLEAEGRVAKRLVERVWQYRPFG